MSRISTEQWERRKWYLLRSLFEENPILSPIPETQEISLEPASPTQTYINRPYSPLPDLIIEKEPNRHDEPEEFYQALETKIKRLYRKLFRDTTISPIITGIENDNYFILDSESCTETAVFVEDPVASEISRNNDESSDDNDQCIVQSDNVRSMEILRYTKSTDTSEKVSTASSESDENEVIVTQALVHHTVSKKNYEGDKVMSNCSETQNDRNIISSRSTIIGSHEQSENEHPQDDFEDTSISNIHQHEDKFKSAKKAIGFLSDASLSPDVPEVMRRRHTSNDSAQSTNSLNIGRYFSAEIFNDKRLEFSHTEEAEFTSPELGVILQPTSTLKKLFQPQRSDRKRRSLSEISSYQSSLSQKQRKYETIAIQTSFSEYEEESNWQEIQKQFFAGNTRIFKLCSCSNHVCC